MRGDVHKIAGMQDSQIFFSLETQARCARQQDNPLILLLVIPLPGRCSLTEREDAFQSKSFAVDDFLKDFFQAGLGQVSKKITGSVIHHRVPLDLCAKRFERKIRTLEKIAEFSQASPNGIIACRYKLRFQEP